MEENLDEREKIRRPQERVKKTIEVDYHIERSGQIIREIEFIPDDSKPV